MQFKSISIELTNGEVYTYSDGWEFNPTPFGIGVRKPNVDGYCEMELDLKRGTLYEHNLCEGVCTYVFFGIVKRFAVEME